MEKEDKAEFFIKLENPAEFRRTLLESSKDVIKTLEKYEMLKAIRVQKVKYMNDLKNIIKDIQLFLDKLKKALPKTKMREKGPKKAPLKALEPEVIPKKKISELTELEDELKKIQSKLDVVG